MSCIVISCKTTSLFNEHKCDNVTYMLYILNCTLSGGYQRSITKCSNVCPWALKSIKQKVGTSGSWYWQILKVLEVFGPCMEW